MIPLNPFPFLVHGLDPKSTPKSVTPDEDTDSTDDTADSEDDLDTGGTESGPPLDPNQEVTIACEGCGSFLKITEREGNHFIVDICQTCWENAEADGIALGRDQAWYGE